MATIPRYSSRAYGKYGSTPPSSVAAPELNQPTATSSTVTNTWTGPSGTYTLERAPVDSTGTVGAYAAVYTGPDKTYQNAGLTFNTRYAYRVKVTVNGVASPYSNVVQVTTAANGSPVITPGTAQGSDSVVFTSATAS